MIARPCLDCGTPTDATRCPSCAQDRPHERARGTRTQRGYDNRWGRLSRRARRLQPWCIDCGTTSDLTTDHLRWPARTLDDVEVVCRPCNSRRGPTRGTPGDVGGRNPRGRHGARYRPPERPSGERT